MHIKGSFFLENPVISITQQQFNTDTTEMQKSPAYIPMSQDNPRSSTVPQYDTVQHCNEVKMETNPAYLTHKNA